MSYNPEKYWSKVAQEIAKRNKGNVIAGDDEPYYIYKRQQFLKLFNKINFRGKSVLELGCGPGGNLSVVAQHAPARLVGVDISENMLKLAADNVKGYPAELIKTDGTGIPLPDNSIDIVYSVTVLQHNTNFNMFKLYLEEMGRVSRDKVFLFERTESTEKGDERNIGRPVSQYTAILNKQGLKLVKTQYLPIHASYYVCGAIRKVFNLKSRAEGAPLSKLSLLLEKITLPVTSIIDKFWLLKKEVTLMEFQKITNP